MMKLFPSATPSSQPALPDERPVRTDTSKIPKRVINIAQYDGDTLEFGYIYPDKKRDSDAALPAREEGKVLWCQFIGIQDASMLHRLLAPFSIHPLVIEDILNTKQRPKIEHYGDYVFMAERALSYDKNRLQTDAMFLILGEGFVFTFQPRPLGIYTSVRERLESNMQNLREQGADYLAYVLIDRLVDDYFSALEAFTARVDEIDRQLFLTENEDVLNRIHRLKRDGIKLRRTLVPMREMLNQIIRGDFGQFRAETHVYLRDVYDHLSQLLESSESARDMVFGMMDIYLSYQSNTLNKQMRLLTVITIIFMPLTVITGIYGMNFEFMPELHWKYGYFMVIGLMACVVIGMLTWFSKRKML